jgi:hypothetical protein
MRIRSSYELKRRSNDSNARRNGVSSRFCRNTPFSFVSTGRPPVPLQQKALRYLVDTVNCKSYSSGVARCKTRKSQITARTFIPPTTLASPYSALVGKVFPWARLDALHESQFAKNRYQRLMDLFGIFMNIVCCHGILIVRLHNNYIFSDVVFFTNLFLVVSLVESLVVY